MSFKYAHAGVYRCYQPGCGAKVVSADGELPPGWVKAVREDLDGWRREYHYCPEHIPERKP